MTWISTYYYRPHLVWAVQPPRGSFMRHFGHIAPEERQRLFYREPAVFSADSPARVLAAALGATLYSPATRPQLADDVVKQAGRGVVSMVLCLEDSIDDADVVKLFSRVGKGTIYQQSRSLIQAVHRARRDHYQVRARIHYRNLTPLSYVPELNLYANRAHIPSVLSYLSPTVSVVSL